MRDSSREMAAAAAIAAIMRRLGKDMRQACMNQIVVVSVNVIREMGFHLSDYLVALANYVETQSSVDPDTEQTRATVASLLETAAIEAETEGRELP